MNPDGRAILKSCHYRVPYDGVSEEYPYHLTTGRNHLHFHTRTKTGRSKRLNDADPHPYIQVHPEDAEDLGVQVCMACHPGVDCTTLTCMYHTEWRLCRGKIALR